jgi:ribosomal protein L34E
MDGEMAEQKNPQQAHDALYCPNCAREITDPLTCGDCSAVICRICGTPLESASDLGMG